MDLLKELGIGYGLLILLAIFAVIKGAKNLIKFILFLILVATIAFAYLMFK